MLGALRFLDSVYPARSVSVAAVPCPRMELVATKILVLTLLGVLRLVCGLLPLKITRGLQEWGVEGKRRKRLDIATSLCLCFGGGVLMATCFIHMIPEVRASLAQVRRAGSLLPADTGFPLAELLICAGFFLVYIVEEVAHHCFMRSRLASTPVKQDNCSSVQTETPRETDVSVNDASRNGGRTHRVAPATSQAHLLASSLTLDEGKYSSQHHHLPVGDIGESTVVGNLRNFLVVLALSFHSLFEGLAIGLQPTEADVWYLFTAVSIHACAILFCVGLELATSSATLISIVAYIVVLAIVSPLGVAAGILVTGVSSSDSAVQTLVIAVLQGVAGGTILYITFFEVLDREKKKETGSGILRVLFVLLGFSLMVALQVIGGHDHGNSPHEFALDDTSRDLQHDHDHGT